MNNNKVLSISFIGGLLIATFTTLVYGFTHAESSLMCFLTFSLLYNLLRFNRIDRKLDALVATGEGEGK